MKVIFVNRFFYPDTSATSQMLSDLATNLAMDHQVHVVTSRLRYDQPDDGLPASERVGGTVVHRVWTSRFGRGSLWGRTVDYVTFYISATLRLLTLVERGDIVVPMTDPPLISVSAAIAGRLKGGQIVNWLQDIFPEVAGELDFKRLASGIGPALAWCRNRSLSMAACNVVLGEVMAARVARLSESPIRLIHNWSSGDQIRPITPEANVLRHRWGLNGKFVVGYSGNMGRAHDFASFLGAAQQLSGSRDIVFLLIGGGKQRPDLESAVRERGLVNVVFQPYQPRELLPLSLTVPDCHVVSLKPSLEGLIVPSKLYSSLASGRPVIFIGSDDGEFGRLMRDTPSFGMRVGPEDTDGLTHAIQYLCDNREEAALRGANGRSMFEQHFDQPIAFEKWRTLIGEIAAGTTLVRLQDVTG